MTAPPTELQHTHSRPPRRYDAASSRALQSAENVASLVRRDTVDRYGSRLLAVLNAVSAHLTTGTLRDLRARVELSRLDPHRGADGWLRTQALTPGRQGAP